LNCRTIIRTIQKLLFVINKMKNLISISLLLVSMHLFAQRTTWAKKIDTKHLQNLYQLNDSIYRCEQPSKKAFKELEKMGIKSDLNLRDNQSDKEFLKKRDIERFRVKMNSEQVTEAQIIEALQDILAAPKPILVHCKHGADRTGVVIAFYRMVFCNWTKQQAIDELKNGGYHFKTKYVNIIKLIEKANIKIIKKAVYTSK
jgi:tyrosine-protein phosphatase SIW14